MKLKINLKLHLAEKRITASELSRVAKVPKATISDWLAGRSPKNLNQIKAVAQVFDTSIDELVFGDFSHKKHGSKDVEKSDLVPMGKFDVYMKRVKE
jgi:transcriptional regulator with XRE-family HTH domain